jgi:hypothetical protein
MEPGAGTICAERIAEIRMAVFRHFFRNGEVPFLCLQINSTYMVRYGAAEEEAEKVIRKDIEG